MADKSPPPAAAADDDLPPPPRRRDRREDRDSDRPPVRRDYAAAGRGSPPPPPPRDRDRDFKRRRSPGGSPPPPYRDRRYSPPPPQQQQQQPFKRPRRGGPDDRFGHGYNGGYDRGMGGRPYSDDKPRGRFMNRGGGGYQHGPADLGFNRGGYADSLNRANAQRDGLMSYKQFIQELEDDVLPAEAERRYQEYQSEYISTLKRGYFNAHKDEEWLKNKYHPTNLLAVIERRNEHARQVAKDLLLDLQSGTLDLSPSQIASSSSKAGQASEHNSDNELDSAGRHKRNDNKGRPEDSAAPKAHPVSCDPARIEADIKQAIAIIHKLDSEKKIEDNVLSNVEYSKKENDKTRGGSTGPIVIIRGLTSVKGLEGTELLDTLITYLWRVHGVDYYGMIETNEAKGLRHVRPDGKNRDEIKESRADWEKKLDSFWKERLAGEDPLEAMTAKEKIEAAAAEVLDPYVRKIRDEKYGWKYGCGAKGCTKLFHASEFVTKHLKLKHPELVVDLTTKLREDLYFQNYMNDPDAPGGKPIMQQPQGRRQPLQNRLRDDRGQRRDNERIDSANDGNRIGNMENSPNRDQQSKSSGGPEMGSHDESVYDAYGQSIGAVASFGSDVPQILMPVPGAGPLGPFVPAPPEVAMQMMRDQGGAAAYDVGGRKMLSGPLIAGPSPIISVPRQDPRRMRSYQDLDAPEDEVTVIDYRSL